MKSSKTTVSAKQTNGDRLLFNLIKRVEFNNNISDTMVGDFKWSALINDINGWLVCDGRSLSRAQYSQLFSIIGTTFGSEDCNTFNLPDARGRVGGAIGQGIGLTIRNKGDMIGEESHTLTADEIPSHSHSITDPGHNHVITTVNDDFNNSGGAGPSFAADGAGIRTWNNTINNATTGITINSAGGGSGHNVMQPTLFIGNLLIYAGIYDYLEGNTDLPFTGPE